MPLPRGASAGSAEPRECAGIPVGDGPKRFGPTAWGSGPRLVLTLTLILALILILVPISLLFLPRRAAGWLLALLFVATVAFAEQWFAAALIAAGWVLATTIATGITRTLWRRQQRR
ncbi:hypothetical protein OG288_41590 [Streptomyces tauricus]|uniref:Uncharacterized protein n=1 Tax=Streptomyces tauricus TaxID=68274 RepID=A0ABZ1JTI6_9ACTN|nr:hypothetical protein [Streptomyces tauricus]